MSNVSDFAAKQKDFQAAMEQHLEGLTKDIKDLNDKVASLDSAEDKAALEEVQNASQALLDKYAALDAQSEEAPAENPPSEPANPVVGSE